MSTHTDRSLWSPEEIDSLENIDKEVQLVSISSDSHSLENHAQENGSAVNGKTMSDCDTRAQARGQSTNQLFNVNSKSSKLYSSCDDLSLFKHENKVNKPEEPKINRSTTFVSFKQIRKSNNSKYDYVQSKIKHYFNNTKAKTEEPVPQSKPIVISKVRESSGKEDYLEQINKQLTKELDEKNAILSLLQENYERLLFKYAEAQNRIDELRFKVMSETSSKNIPVHSTKQYKLDNQISPSFPCNNKYENKFTDMKCQKAVVAPFIKTEEPPDDDVILPPNRPSSLPLDDNLKFVERDLLKATTPTDSEGLSSIITSMSGHSKILNSLDEENQISKKSNYMKYQSNDFILEENSNLNDPFDKVKNWQNSLPPLEQIETPETTLYNVFPNSTGAYSSSETKYKEISSPKVEKDYMFSDESCPDSWREERPFGYSKNNSERTKTEEFNNISHRTVSLPTTLSKRNVFYKKTHHSLDTSTSERVRFQNKENTQATKADVSSGCINQRGRLGQKRPPLLRCSSLPTYDHDSIKSGNYKNGIYIPPLDLGNVTLSDDESYCQQEFYVNKSNTATLSSFLNSRDGSFDQSLRTPQSFSSCKATISEETSYPRVPRQTLSKSTSITPERSRAMDLFFASKYDSSRRKTSDCIKECSECCSDKSRNRCNVCGESISENRNLQFFRNRSNSCESVHKGDISMKDPPARRPKTFKRSVSFGSETCTPKYSSREEDTPRNFFSRLSQENFDDFDGYANSLKARSQIVIKALTAHVNNYTQ